MSADTKVIMDDHYDYDDHDYEFPESSEEDYLHDEYTKDVTSFNGHKLVKYESINSNTTYYYMDGTPIVNAAYYYLDGMPIVNSLMLVRQRKKKKEKVATILIAQHISQLRRRDEYIGMMIKDYGKVCDYVIPCRELADAMYYYGVLNFDSDLMNYLNSLSFVGAQSDLVSMECLIPGTNNTDRIPCFLTRKTDTPDPMMAKYESNGKNNIICDHYIYVDHEDAISGLKQIDTENAPSIDSLLSLDLLREAGHNFSQYPVNMFLAMQDSPLFMKKLIEDRLYDNNRFTTAYIEKRDAVTQLICLTKIMQDNGYSLDEISSFKIYPRLRTTPVVEILSLSVSDEIMMDDIADYVLKNRQDLIDNLNPKKLKKYLRYIFDEYYDPELVSHSTYFNDCYSEFRFTSEPYYAGYDNRAINFDSRVLATYLMNLLLDDRQNVFLKDMSQEDSTVPHETRGGMIAMLRERLHLLNTDDINMILEEMPWFADNIKHILSYCKKKLTKAAKR